MAYTTTSSQLINVSFSGHSPLGSTIMWFKDNVLMNTVPAMEGLDSGQTTITVYQKNDTGHYKVVVETVGIDEVEPPYLLTDEVSFHIDVLSEFLIYTPLIVQHHKQGFI